MSRGRRSGLVESAVGRGGNGRFRRILVINGCSREGPLTEPTAVLQVGGVELQTRPLAGKRGSRTALTPFREDAAEVPSSGPAPRHAALTYRVLDYRDQRFSAVFRGQVRREL